MFSQGEGRSYPDPADQVVLDDGMIVPTGKAVQSDLSNTSLLYNEYPFGIYHLWLFYFPCFLFFILQAVDTIGNYSK